MLNFGKQQETFSLFHWKTWLKLIEIGDILGCLSFVFGIFQFAEDEKQKGLLSLA